MKEQHLIQFSNKILFEKIIFDYNFFINYNFLICIKHIVKGIKFFHESNFSFDGKFNQKSIFFSKWHCRPVKYFLSYNECIQKTNSNEKEDIKEFGLIVREMIRKFNFNRNNVTLSY